MIANYLYFSRWCRDYCKASTRQNIPRTAKSGIMFYKVFANKFSNYWNVPYTLDDEENCRLNFWKSNSVGLPAPCRLGWTQPCRAEKLKSLSRVCREPTMNVECHEWKSMKNISESLGTWLDWTVIQKSNQRTKRTEIVSNVSDLYMVVESE